MSDQTNVPVEKKETNRFFQVLMLAILAGGGTYLMGHLDKVWNIILVLAGFGAVVSRRLPRPRHQALSSRSLTYQNLNSSVAIAGFAETGYKVSVAQSIG